MPAVDGTLRPLGSSLAWWRQGIAQWHALEEVTKVRAKVVLLVGATVIGFHYSLLSLVQTVGLDTPLAYVGLVPLLAAFLAWVNRAPRKPEPPVHDRQTDYLLGVPLVVLTLVGSTVLPARVGALYWVNRLDLALLPLFVTGATILLFGTRVAWRQRVALAYLVLAWPWLYTSILLGALGGFTSVTLRALDGVLRYVHVATPVAGAENAGTYVVVHHGQVFPVSVVTACSGVDGMVGFLLIGAALAAVVDGGLRRKALWLASGLVLVWLANLLRLLGIFWVGRVAGKHVALDVLHPVAGLITFAVGVAIMAGLLRVFGLRPRAPRPASSARKPEGLRVATAVPSVFVAAAIVLCSALFLSVANSGLRVYDPVASASGQPRLGSFLAQPAVPSGWSVSYLTEFESNKALFGGDSRWFRYLYVPGSSGQRDLHSTLPVTADVIDAGGLSGFDAYGVTACYSFHGYALRNVGNVDLGDGIEGQSLSYWGGASHQDWSIVYWVWPVQTGAGTRYERVVLSLQDTAAGQVSLAPWTRGVAGPTRGRGTDPVVMRLAVNRAFLVAFARQIVTGQSAARDTGIFVDYLPTPAPAGQWLAAPRLHSGPAAGPAGRGAGTAGTAATSEPSLTSGEKYAQFWSQYFSSHRRGAPGAS